MCRRSNFRQLSLRFRELLLSVSFSGPSWVRVALHCIYPNPHNSWETWEWGCPSHSLILCMLYISCMLCLPLNFWNPCQPSSVGCGTNGLVLKWERRESINIRVIRYPTRVTRLTKRTSKRAKDPERINTREKTEKAIWNRLHYSPALKCVLCA